MKALIFIFATSVLAFPTFSNAAEPEQIVDAMQALAGKSKNRLSGAKGQCVIGTFTPTPDAKQITKSAAFAAPSKVVGRFAVGGGNPKVADGTKTVNRSFSFRIDDGGKATTEFVMVNAPINFVKSPEQMLAFLQARAPGADGKPDPEKIKA
jgi:catalase